jgi:hypothetical protein
MGFGPSTDGWRLFDPENRRYDASRDAYFYEKIKHRTNIIVSVILILVEKLCGKAGTWPWPLAIWSLILLTRVMLSENNIWIRIIYRIHVDRLKAVHKHFHLYLMIQVYHGTSYPI